MAWGCALNCRTSFGVDGITSLLFLSRFVVWGFGVVFVFVFLPVWVRSKVLMGEAGWGTICESRLDFHHPLFAVLGPQVMATLSPKCFLYQGREALGTCTTQRMSGTPFHSAPHTLSKAKWACNFFSTADQRQSHSSSN